MSQTVRRIWHRCPFSPTICKNSWQIWFRRRIRKNIIPSHSMSMTSTGIIRKPWWNWRRTGQHICAPRGQIVWQSLSCLLPSQWKVPAWNRECGVYIWIQQKQQGYIRWSVLLSVWWPWKRIGTDFGRRCYYKKLPVWSIWKYDLWYTGKHQLLRIQRRVCEHKYRLSVFKSKILQSCKWKLHNRGYKYRNNGEPADTESVWIR